MPDKILHKRNLTSNITPTTSSLSVGELAINVADAKIFVKQSGSSGEFVRSVVTLDVPNTGSINLLGNITASYLLGTASNATSASYATNADLLDGKDSTVFATTGSNIFVGNQTVTGSLFTTGSNTLVGTTTLTGSLNVSGSTTQIGNNNLFGSTTLSGSLTVSGTLSAGTPNINFYGDTGFTGYAQFNPVSTNINTALSGSYIYVSGSTNDLYFSQNGAGYSNVTRLRWLEGNLYTGLLNGGLITTQSSTVYQVSSGSGIIVNLNASISNNPYPTIQYLNWGNLTKNIAPLSASYDQQFIGIDNTNNIFAQGTPFVAGQYDTLIPLGLVLHQNNSTINGVKTQPSVAYGWKQRSSIFQQAFGPLKLSGFTLAVSGSSTGSLVVGSGTAYADGFNYTLDANNPSYVTDAGTSISKIFRYYQSGSEWVYNTNGGAGYGTIDPTQYAVNGVLTAVPGGGSNREWTNQRVYWFPNSVTKAIVVYYGNASYPTQLDAIANINIESFNEAPNTAANAVYLGVITVRNNADFTNADSFKISPSGLFRQVGGSGGGGSVITQVLSGLADVSITSPTDHQPLAYDTTAGKWTNQSNITANITGNATTATSASYATTASFAVSASWAPTQAMGSTAWGDLTGIPVGLVSSSTQINTGSFSGSFVGTLTGTSSWATSASYVLPSGLPAGTVSSSGQISYTGLSNIPSGIVSSSAQVIAFLPNGTVSSSVQINTGSFTGSFIGTHSGSIFGTASFATSASFAPTILPTGVVSSSAQVSYTGLSNIPSGIISSSAQVTAFLPTGTVSSSVQINTGSFSGSFTGTLIGTSSWAQTSSVAISASYAPTILPSGIVSSSTQINYTQLQNIPSGIVSSSTQINTGSFSGSFTGTFVGTSSWASNAVSSSFVTTASAATSITFTPTTASFASTASFVNILNQNVSASGNIAAGANLISNNSSGDEGGEILLAKPQTNSTIAGTGVTIDIFQNRLRFFEQGGSARGFFVDMTAGAASAGTNLQAASSAVSTYTNASDNRVITSTGAAGINAEANLTFDGTVLAINTNNAKFLQGGDDSALHDINVANTLGVYGIQDSTVGAIKLGSSGQVIYSNATGVGIGTITPGALLHVQGNVSASSFTGSLFGTSSWASNSVSASAATSITFTPTTASFATTASAATSITFTPATASFATSASFAPTILPTGTVSSSGQVSYTGLSNVPSSIVSSSGQVTAFLPVGTVSSSTQVSYTGLSNIPSGIVSSSAQVTAFLPVGTVSSSTQINTGSFTGSFVGTLTGSMFGTASWANNATSASFATTASFAPTILPSGVVSSSTQVSYTGLSNIPANIVSSSTQVTAFLPTGTVSSSGQVSYTGLSNVPSGIVSSSNQFNALTNTSASYATRTPLGTSYDSRSITFVGNSRITEDGSGNIDIIAGSPASYAEIGSFNNENYVYVDNFGAYMQTNYTTNPTRLWTFGMDGTLTTPGLIIGTASWASNVVSSSFATTASYALNATATVPAGTVSSSLQFNSLTLPFTGSFTGSFKGDGTGLTGITATAFPYTGAAVISGSLIVTGSSGVTVTGPVTITGALQATTKSFKIDHQILLGKKLIYGVLEGPEHGVYVRGRLTKNTVIQLPDEWEWLVDPDSITVQLTPIGTQQILYVQNIENNTVIINSSTPIDCFYFVQATRKDVAPLTTVE